MKKYFKKISFMVLALWLSCTGCSQKPISAQCVDTAMGTIVNQTIYVSSDEQHAREISAKVLACIDDLEQNTLSWRLETSEVYQINECAGSGQTYLMSSRLGKLLEECNRVYAASDGAFDVTIGSVARLWNIDTWAASSMQQERDVLEDTASDEGSSLLPTEEQLAEAFTHVGTDKSSIEDGRIALPEEMQLDLGAVGKGIALDEIGNLLTQQEAVTGAVISVGGSILTYGSKPDGSNWQVGIVNPADTSSVLGTLSLSGDYCVSTSGDYERFVEVDGIRYHHILDPRTGMPADNGVKSVTILCGRGTSGNQSSGLFSDALSTACFVLGVEDGLKLAELFDAEVLFVDAQGQITMSDGMKSYFHLSNAGK